MVWLLRSNYNTAPIPFTGEVRVCCENVFSVEVVHRTKKCLNFLYLVSHFYITLHKTKMCVCRKNSVLILRTPKR